MRLKELFESAEKSVADLGIKYERYKSGRFDCSRKQLTSLEGSPKHITKYFICSDNQLTSLKGAPNRVDGNFDCFNNNLLSLEGAPEYVGGNFSCYNNELVSLEGLPSRFDGCLFCLNNKLTSLKGAPSHVRSFSCANNKLTSLEYSPKVVMGYFDCSSNNISSLEGIHKRIEVVDGPFDAHKNPIKSHVLGLLVIKGITEIQLDNQHVQTILNKYLGKGRAGMLQAQEELIEVGLEEFAQL